MRSAKGFVPWGLGESFLGSRNQGVLGGSGGLRK